MITTFDKLRKTIQERRATPTNTTSRIYAFIVAYKTEHNGNSPTVRQMMKAMNFKTPSAVVKHLDKLVNQGKIRQEEGSRGIIVVGSKWEGPKESYDVFSS